MARKLRDKDIQTIVEVIDGWHGKLTYERLLDTLEKRLLHRFTRQALFAHVRIKNAFNLRKESLKSSPSAPTANSPELQKALEKINRIEAENLRLTRENESLLAQFVRWATNAHSAGFTLEQLDRALRPPDRRQSKA